MRIFGVDKKTARKVKRLIAQNKMSAISSLLEIDIHAAKGCNHTFNDFCQCGYIIESLVTSDVYDTTLVYNPFDDKIGLSSFGDMVEYIEAKFLEYEFLPEHVNPCPECNQRNGAYEYNDNVSHYTCTNCLHSYEVLATCDDCNEKYKKCNDCDDYYCSCWQCCYE